MGKTIVINEKHLSCLKDATSCDEFMIGSEKSAPIGGAYSHVCDGVVKENSEFEVNSSDVDLSSFKRKNELSPKIWDGEGNIDSRVRLKLLDIADDFWEYVNIKWVRPCGVILTGSICNYNWSSYSDIDLHLIVDFHDIDSKTEFVRDYLDSKKNEWNDMHSQLEIRGYKVELYVQDVGENAESNGVYDLESNEWVKKPVKGDIKPIGLNKYHIKDKAADIMTIIDDMYESLESTDDKHNMEEIGDDASYLWKKIKHMRKKSLDKHGESGIGNIVYKSLRREGYLDKLFDLMSLSYDKVNSIDEIFSRPSVAEFLSEEVVADGNAEHNPCRKRWREDRKLLKNFLTNYGRIMTSKENGKEYKVYYDAMLSQMIGVNYCICIQRDSVATKPSSTIYVRALDKFTDRRFKANFDASGMDNEYGTNDDII